MCASFRVSMCMCEREREKDYFYTMCVREREVAVFAIMANIENTKTTCQVGAFLRTLKSLYIYIYIY